LSRKFGPISVREGSLGEKNCCLLWKELAEEVQSGKLPTETAVMTRGPGKIIYVFEN